MSDQIVEAFQTVPDLETPHLRLRHWSEDDATPLHAAFGDAETMRFWDSPPTRDLAATAASIRDSRSADPRFHAALSIVRKAGSEVVGMVNYHARQPLNRRLAVGWILVPAWQRRGIMREAMPAFLNHCFDHLQTHRIEARIEPENTASARLAECLGFTPEGLMRDWMFVGDEPRSVRLYALLRADWKVAGC
jgi:[ribosomal protein S5]-alanine N-acetyltransferase